MPGEENIKKKKVSLISSEWHGICETEPGQCRKDWERLLAIKNTSAEMNSSTAIHKEIMLRKFF